MIVTPSRMMYYIPIQGYRHMYRSLMRYFGMNRLEVSSLLFPLYLGNMDTCVYSGVHLPEVELTMDGFYSLSEPYARPYHTELQMYKSMIVLMRNNLREATGQESRAAYRQFSQLTNQLMNRFETVFDCEITDPRTRYDECWGRLQVRDSEPTTIFKCSRQEKLYF